jgi:Alpha/beta hydrolase family
LKTSAFTRRFGSGVRALSGVVLLTTFAAQCGTDIAKPEGLRMTTLAGHSTAELGNASATKAVVMVHGRSTHKDSWYPVMPKLAAAGYRTVAYDYDSSGDADVAAVVQQLRDDGVTEFVLMGSSLGAGHALRASRDCDVGARATITYSAVEAVDVPFQPILAVASKNDGTTAAKANEIANNQGLRSRALIIAGSTHGVDMVNGHPEAIDQVVEWLKALPAVRPGPDREPQCIDSSS